MPWRRYITARLEDRHVVLEGAIPGEYCHIISVLRGVKFIVAGTRYYLMGGLREGGSRPENIFYQDAQPLSEVTRDINKFSSNTMKNSRS